MNEKIEGINAEKAASKLRQKRLQQWFRMLDRKWNFGSESTLSLLWLLLLFAIELMFLFYGGSSIARAITYSGTNLLIYVVILIMKPSAPNMSKRPKDQKALIEYMSDLLLYERVLPVVPMKNTEYVKLCFERWWKISGFSLLCGDAAILSVLTFYVKTLDIEQILLLVFLLMTPIAFLFLEIPKLFPGKKANFLYLVFGVAFPYGLYAAMFGRGVYQMVTEKVQESIAVSFPLPVAAAVFVVLLILYIGGYGLFQILLHSRRNVSWNMDRKKKEA